MKVLISGDFVVNRPYSQDAIDKEITKIFKNSDFNIVNLEAPVTKSNFRILKTGPHLKADERSTKEVLKSLKIDLVTLANNHVLDYDVQGVLDTLNFCKDNGIATVGVGRNKEEAAQNFYLDSEVGRIAIINIAENEWASATESSAGANGMDLIKDVLKIQEAQEECEFVFVIVHGGHEYYNLPSPRMQKQYRFYVDNGADLVVGHHTHCISGMEMYKNKPIYYSLGNFLFSKHSNYEDWYKGIVLEVEICKDRKLIANPLFVQQTKRNFHLSIIGGDHLSEITNRFNTYSAIIQDEKGMLENWESFINKCSSIYENYYSPLNFVSNRYVRALLSRLGWNGSNKKENALYLNLLRCEAHADLSKAVMENKINK